MTTLPDAVRTLFDGPNYAHLATVLPDGATRRWRSLMPTSTPRTQTSTHTQAPGRAGRHVGSETPCVRRRRSIGWAGYLRVVGERRADLPPGLTSYT
jgi:hypothetical protein